MYYGNYCDCFNSDYFIYGSHHNGVKIMIDEEMAKTKYKQLCDYTDQGYVNVLKQIDDCLSFLRINKKKYIEDAESYKKQGNEVLEAAYRKFACRQEFQIQMLANFKVIFEKWATADNDKVIIREMSKKFYELIDLSYF